MKISSHSSKRSYLPKRVALLFLLLLLPLSVPDLGAAPKRERAKARVVNTEAKGGKPGKKGAKSAGKGKTGKKRSSANRGNSDNAPRTAAEAKNRQKAAQQEVVRTREQIKENEASVKKNLAALGRLQQDIQDGKALVDAERARVNALQRQIANLETEISSSESQLNSLRAEYLKAVKKMQVRRHDQSVIAFIFSSSGFSQAMRRMRYLKEFSDWRKKQTQSISAHVASLKDARAKLSAAQSSRQKALDRQNEAQRQLQVQYGKQDALVCELKRNGQVLQAHLARKQAEVNGLKARVATLIAEETRRAEQQRKADEAKRAEQQRKADEARVAAQQSGGDEMRKSEKKEETRKTKETRKNAEPSKEKKTEKVRQSSKTSEEEPSYAEVRKRKPKQKTTPSASPAPQLPAATPGGKSFESMRGSLPRPVAGEFRVTSRFGSNSLPDMPSVVYDNPGIDAQVARRAAVQAVYAAVVSGVYVVPGYGNVVILNHGSYYTVYGNLADTSVKTGDSVTAGSLLGHAADAEEDTSRGSVHFEVWHGREKQNPLSWIR